MSARICLDSEAVYISSLSVKIPTFIRHCDQVARCHAQEDKSLLLLGMPSSPP